MQGIRLTTHSVMYALLKYTFGMLNHNFSTSNHTFLALHSQQNDMHVAYGPRRGQSVILKEYITEKVLHHRKRYIPYYIT